MSIREIPLAQLKPARFTEDQEAAIRAEVVPDSAINSPSGIEAV